MLPAGYNARLKCIVVNSHTGGTESSCSPGSLRNLIDNLKRRRKAVNNAKLGDPVAGGQMNLVGGEIGDDYLDLAPIPGIDDAGERGNALYGQARAILDEGSVLSRELHHQAGGDKGRLAGSQGGGLAGVEIGSEVAPGTVMGVARKAGFGVQHLDADGDHIGFKVNENKGMRPAGMDEPPGSGLVKDIPVQDNRGV